MLVLSGIVWLWLRLQEPKWTLRRYLLMLSCYLLLIGGWGIESYVVVEVFHWYVIRLPFRCWYITYRNLSCLASFTRILYHHVVTHSVQALHSILIRFISERTAHNLHVATFGFNHLSKFVDYVLPFFLQDLLYILALIMTTGPYSLGILIGMRLRIMPFLLFLY